MNRIIAASLLLTLLGGCAIDARMEREMNDDVTARRDTVASNLAKAVERPADKPFIGSRLIKRKQADEALPEAFSQSITFGDGALLSLTRIGQNITALTRIPVNISPDLLPSATATSGSGGSTTDSSGSASTGTASAVSNPLPQMAIAFSGSLSELLDRVASRMGIAWEYRNGAINFSRYVTRIYMINMYPGKSNQTASVGKTGSSTTGAPGSSSALSSGGSFSSSSASDFSSNLDPWSTLDTALRALTTSSGKYAISSTTGMIVVTDTKDVQDRVSSYLKKLDKIMNLQITLKVAVISVDADNRDQAGIDWNLVWNKLASIAPNYALSFRGVPNPAALTQAGGGLGLAILTPTGGGAGKWDGSAAMFRALNSVSKATMVTDNVWHALNKQPLSVALADQTGFASTSTEQNTTGGNPVATTTVTMLTTGFILNMLPSTSDGEEVALQFSLDISTPPVVETFGTVQVPKYSSKQIGQRAKLREGETLILSGFSLHNRSLSKSGLFSPNDPILMGGNRNGDMRDQDLVILITPIIE